MKQKLKIGAKYALYSFAYLIILGIVLNIVGINPETNAVDVENAFRSGRPFLIYAFNFLLLVLIVPLIEEALFRFLPISVVRKFTNNTIILWMVIVLSSVIFGYLHNGDIVLVGQGVLGIILSMAFLKGGYVASVTTHAIINGTMTMFVVINPQEISFWTMFWIALPIAVLWSSYKTYKERRQHKSLS